MMAKKGTQVTLMEVVQRVQESARSDAEAVAVLVHLMKTGRIILHGKARR